MRLKTCKPAGGSTAEVIAARLREAQTLFDKGNLAQAAEAYRRIRDEKPQIFEGWHFGGMVALRLNRTTEAEKLLAGALERNRGSAPTALGLAIARLSGGDAVGAEQILREVTMGRPQLTEAWHYLALALKAQRRLPDVLEVRERLVKMAPSSASAWANLGVARSDLGRHTDALQAFAKAIELEPADTRTLLTRAMTLFKSHRVVEAAEEFARLTGDRRVQGKARSCRLMTLNYLPALTREEIWAEHRDYGAAFGAAENRKWANRPDPCRRLRLAFLSPDLNHHSIAYFLEPLLQQLDRAEFEVVLYHDHAKVDATSDRLKSHAAVWRNLVNRPHDVVERTILEDAPDVLVDLTGHAGANRLAALARRLAPVQITYLGYPNTTGVPAVDYRFVDGVTDPANDADRLASEKLIRFAPTAWSYLPPEVAPEVNDLPSTANGFVTFGSFNNFAKVTDPMLRTWARILAAVPNSRLLVKAAGMEDLGVRNDVEARMRRAGIPDARVELVAQVRETAAHLAMYGRVDIALDAYPYHGTTTTCEALWMGVPVVTRVGDRHVARVGLSLLTSLGRTAWAANNEEAYVRIAVDLARDVERLAEIRRTLRDAMRRSELLNHAGQARRFGEAVRGCWREWCANPVATAAA